MGKPSNIIPISQEAHLNWMLYSEPGVGKTMLAGTAAEVGKTLWLANNPDETVSLRKQTHQPDMWVVDDYNELADAAAYVINEGHAEYDFVVFDNGTLFMEQGMDHIMADLVATKPHRDLYIPDRAEYLRNQNMFSKQVRTLIGAPVNFIMTAHVMQMESPEGDDISIPALPGSKGLYSQKLCGLMNLVTYYRAVAKKGGVQRVLYTQKSKTMEAKDRFQALPARMIDPTVPQIMDAIQGTPKRRPAKKTTKATSRK